MSLADAGGMHQRTMIWTTAKRCRPGKMRPFHACMLRGKEKPDYPQASAISQSEKQRSIKVESSLSSTTYRYKTGAALLSGRPIKCHFDGRRNPGRHGNAAMLKIPPCTAPVFLLEEHLFFYLDLENKADSTSL